ncbi:hypothetical protein FRX94_06855 [Corynebacterium canis]|uniref:Excisionase n=1 Tax=Corynebacterium canis TaxID=679663 RepID=A0A5C5UIS7_9CORY|nr:hypothetical protein [Corynebacterium canis]TWT25522.1 hypothetical protein FRX94_06855 [Corynebacterium canis]WJY76211.1 hypothetical protein CCANI_12025 [Corynebacterium canis]
MSAATTAPHKSHAASSVVVPEWFDLKTAGKILSVSPLHVRILARDSVLRSRADNKTIMVCAKDVLAYRPQAQAAQREFAFDVAHVENLRSRIIDHFA